MVETEKKIEKDSNCEVELKKNWLSAFREVSHFSLLQQFEFSGNDTVSWRASIIF